MKEGYEWSLNGRVSLKGSPLQRNIALVIWMKLIFGAAGIVMPTMVIFLESADLSLAAIFQLQATYHIAVVMLEVPSGYLADVVGRRRCVLAGFTLASFGFMLYAAGAGFWHFLMAELVLAGGLALLSGSLEAVLYDSLLAMRLARRYQEVWGRAVSLSVLVMAASSVSAGFIAALHLSLPMVVGGLVLALGVPAAYMLVEPPRTSIAVDANHVAELRKVLHTSLVANFRVRWLIGYTAFLFGATMPAVWLYAPYFEQCSVPLELFGVLFALFQVVAALGARLSEPVSRRLSEVRFHLLVLLLLVASFFSLSVWTTAWAIGFIGLQQLTRGALRVTYSALINREVESRTRATVNSLGGLCNSLSSAAVMTAVSLGTADVSLSVTFLLWGAAALVIGLLLLLVRCCPPSSEVVKQYA